MASSRFGAFVRLVIWLKAVFYTALVIAVLLFAPQAWPLDLLTFAWPFVVFSGIALIVVAGIFRLRAPLLVAAVGTLLSILPFWQTPAAPQASGERTLRVMTANLYMEAVDPPDAFVALVRAEDPDILVLDEVRPEWADAVSATRIYAYESSRDLPARDDKKVFSKFPILSETPLIDEMLGWYRRRSPVRFELDRNGSPLTLYAIHPETPRRLWQWRERNAYLAAIASDAQARGGDIIAAGDWNTPQWSPYFRGTLEASGLKTTAIDPWPPATRFSLKLWPTLRLGVAIDHIAVSDRFAVSGWRMGPYFGSNHFTVTADLVLR